MSVSGRRGFSKVRGCGGQLNIGTRRKVSVTQNSGSWEDAFGKKHPGYQGMRVIQNKYVGA